MWNSFDGTPNPRDGSLLNNVFGEYFFVETPCWQISWWNPGTPLMEYLDGNLLEPRSSSLNESGKLGSHNCPCNRHCNDYKISSNLIMSWSAIVYLQWRFQFSKFCQIWTDFNFKILYEENNQLMSKDCCTSKCESWPEGIQVSYWWVVGNMTLIFPYGARVVAISIHFWSCWRWQRLLVASGCPNQPAFLA